MRLARPFGRLEATVRQVMNQLKSLRSEAAQRKVQELSSQESTHASQAVSSFLILLAI